MFVIRVYLAGLSPLNDTIASICHACNKRNFVPIIPSGTAKENLNLLDHADAVIANLTLSDGGGVYDGTAFEIGYAKARGIPVYGYTIKETQLNFMISANCKIVIGTIDDALDCIKHSFNTF